MLSLHHARLCRARGLKISLEEFKQQVYHVLEAEECESGALRISHVGQKFHFSIRPLPQELELWGSWCDGGAKNPWQKRKRPSWQKVEERIGCLPLWYCEESALEAAWGNLFLLHQDGFSTPPLGRILPGVMRTVAIVAAEQLGITMRVQSISIYERGQWFLTTALRSLTPIFIDREGPIEASILPTLRAKMDRLQAEEEELCLSRYIEEWESVRPLIL